MPETDNQVLDGLVQRFRPPRNYLTGLSSDRICEWQTAKGPGSLEAGLSGAVALSFLLTFTFLPYSPLKRRRRRAGEILELLILKGWSLNMDQARSKWPQTLVKRKTFLSEALCSLKSVETVCEFSKSYGFVVINLRLHTSHFR